MTNLSSSELILNADGSIYHLHLFPHEVPPIVIFVGDPERVAEVSKHFDSVSFTRQHREFVCHAGNLNKKQLMVLSTGIGTDNIDIVMNELDALVNIDFETRLKKDSLTALTIIRLGTSGSIQKNIDTGAVLLSEYAIGLDGLMAFYDHADTSDLLPNFLQTIPQISQICVPYCAKRSFTLKNETDFIKGITLTSPGFYAPQNRSIRAQSKLQTIFDKINGFEWNNLPISNMEMETAGIYGMASLLGHKALSVNAILANRVTKKFHSNPSNVVQEMIEKVLALL